MFSCFSFQNQLRSCNLCEQETIVVIYFCISISTFSVLKALKERAKNC